MIIALRVAQPDYPELLLMTHRLPRIVRVAVCCLHIRAPSAAVVGSLVAFCST